MIENFSAKPVYKKLDSEKINNGRVMLSNIFWTGLSILALVLLSLKVFVYQQVNVVGQSMQPNFHNDEKLLLDKTKTNLERGQVVSFYDSKYSVENSNFITKLFPSFSPTPIKFLLKRVIGLPGEEIEIVGSKVIIYNSQNPKGVVIDETGYITDATRNQMEIGCASYGTYFARYKIDANHYFLMGDNRCNSDDSRDKNYGAFDVSQFFGAEVVRYWPVSDIRVGSLPEYRYQPVDSATELKIQQNQKDTVR
jgi:signal peptidase I